MSCWSASPSLAAPPPNNCACPAPAPPRRLTRCAGVHTCRAGASGSAERAMDDIRDHTIEQHWSDYSQDEHAIWRLLFDRQQRLLVGRACRDYLDGLQALGVAAAGVPVSRRRSALFDRATGWRIVAVPGIAPDELFFALPARRRFPSTCFIRH